MLSRQLRWVIVISAIGLGASVASYEFELTRDCTVRQMDIAGGAKKYDATHDAQFCDALNTKISKYNDECKSSIEELDCG